MNDQVKTLKQQLSVKSLELTNSELSTIISTYHEVLKQEIVANGSVSIQGFVSFKTRSRKEMNKINPKTQAPIVVPAQKVVKVTISKTLKEAVKNS